MSFAIDLQNLYTLPKTAAKYVEHHGWTQGTERNSVGQVCLTGALRYCSPVPGDGFIAREVFRRRGHAESWNDDRGRGATEVITYLAESEITDAELAETFGPQWLEIVTQVRTISGATPEQIDELAAARDATRDAAWSAAWSAARDAAWSAESAESAARDAAWSAESAAWSAESAAWSAAESAARSAAESAARSAALGLVTRDLIGTGSYTQEHYDKLTAPWVSVFGKLHADDVIE